MATASPDETTPDDIELAVQKVRTQIVETIKTPQVVQLLIPHVLSQVIGREIKTLYSVSTLRANHRLLDEFLESKYPGKWTAFQQALKEAGYEHLATTIEDEDVIPWKNDLAKQVIRHYSPRLLLINPREILFALVKHDLINQWDADEVLALDQNEGSLLATRPLIERVQTHGLPHNWFLAFTQALEDCQQAELAQMMKEKYTEFESSGPKDLAYVCVSDLASTKETSEVDLRIGIEEYWDELVELIDASDVIPYLEHTVLDTKQRDELELLSRSCPKEATAKLLEIITKYKKETEFVHALCSADYPYAAKLISKPDQKTHHQYLRKVIQIFAPEVGKQINPIDILFHLVHKGVLNRADMENIMGTYTKRGKLQAAMMMLDRIQCRLEPTEWYTVFLQALVETEHQHIAEIIEPDFCNNPENFICKLNLEGLEVCSNSENTESSDIDREIAEAKRKLREVLISGDKTKETIIEETDHVGVAIAAKLQELDKIVTDTKSMWQEKIRRLEDIRERLLAANDTVNIKEKLKEFDSKALPVGFSFTTYLDVKLFKNVGNLRCVYVNSNTLNTHPHQAAVLPPALSLIQVTKENNTGESSRDTASSISQKSSNDSSAFIIVNSDKRNYLEANHFKQSHELHEVARKLSCSSDIIVANKEYLVCFDKETGNLCLRLKSNFNLMQEIFCYKQFETLAMVNKNILAAISKDNMSISLFSLQGLCEHQSFLWSCYGRKCAVAGFEKVLVVLCSEKHIHVFRLEMGAEAYVDIGGLPLKASWRPSYVTFDNKGTCIYITEGDSNINSIDPYSGKIMWSYTLNQSFLREARFGGLCYSHGIVFVFDRDEDQVVRISSSGQWRGTEQCDSFPKFQTSV